MDTRNGNLYTSEEAQAERENMNEVAKEMFDKALKKISADEYDKYAKLTSMQRPVARAFDNYLGEKRRWAERTPRDAFEAGYKAALSDNDIKPPATTDDESNKETA
jgi:predicted trehalose synthase